MFPKDQRGNDGEGPQLMWYIDPMTRLKHDHRRFECPRCGNIVMKKEHPAVYSIESRKRICHFCCPTVADIHFNLEDEREEQEREEFRENNPELFLPTKQELWFREHGRGNRWCDKCQYWYIEPPCPKCGGKK